MEMPIDYGAIANQVIDAVDVDKLISNLQDYRDYAAKKGQCDMANNLQNAIMVISAMRYYLNRMTDNINTLKTSESSQNWHEGWHTGKEVAEMICGGNDDERNQG